MSDSKTGMSVIKITTSQNIDIEYELAGLGERIAAGVIDTLIKLAYAFIVFLLGVGIMDDMGTVYFIVVIALPFSFYTLVSEVLMNGQTVGKKVMSIKVVSMDGGQATAGQYIIRWLFQPVDFYMTVYSCAFLTVGFSDKSQRLGDMVAGTLVIRTAMRTSLNQTLFVPPVEAPQYTVTFPEAAGLTDRDAQLIKDVLLSVYKSGNSLIAFHAVEKIKQVLQVQSAMEPVSFLQILLADYNYLTSTL